MKQILYDTGHLAVARWLFQKEWKFKPPIWQADPPNFYLNKFVLKCFLGNIKCFKLMIEKN